MKAFDKIVKLYKKLGFKFDKEITSITQLNEAIASQPDVLTTIEASLPSSSIDDSEEPAAPTAPATPAAPAAPTAPVTPTTSVGTKPAAEEPKKIKNNNPLKAMDF